MLAFVKGILRYLLPLGMYLGVWAAALISLFRNARVGLLLILILSANLNVWRMVHPFPLGKDTMDLLFICAAIGVSVNNGGYDKPARLFYVILLVFVYYLSAWNASMRFGLGLPITFSNPLVLELKNYVQMVLLYVLAYNCFKEEEQQKTLVLIIAIVIAFVCVREIRNFSLGAAFSYDKRSAGPFWSIGLGPNHFGAWLAYIGSFLLGIALMDDNRRRKLILFGATALTVYPLFSTYSRGSWAAVMVALFVFGVLRKRIILGLLMVLIGTWQTLLPATVVERVTMTETESGEIESSAALRLQLWEKARELFDDNPVFGIGYQGFSRSVNVDGLTNVHNYYMQTAAEQGYIGLFVLGLGFLLAAHSAFRLFRSGRSPFHRGIGLGFLGAVLAMMVSNMFGDRWSYFSLGAIYWIVWGVTDRAWATRNELPVATEAVGRVAERKTKLRLAVRRESRAR
jgi:putative inorganic carbon (hco3(-)) transporter